MNIKEAGKFLKQAYEDKRELKIVFKDSEAEDEFYCYGTVEGVNPFTMWNDKKKFYLQFNPRNIKKILDRSTKTTYTIR